MLAEDDAVANKVLALYSRAQARDFIDVDAALSSGRYTRESLTALARVHDPGFDDGMFSVALRAVGRLPLAEFTAYGLSEDRARSLVARFMEWGGRSG